MLYPARLFKGSAAFRCFALALCSRYSGTRSALTGYSRAPQRSAASPSRFARAIPGTRSALTGFAGSQTGALLHVDKSDQGTREHTSALAVNF